METTSLIQRKESEFLICLLFILSEIASNLIFLIYF